MVQIKNFLIFIHVAAAIAPAVALPVPGMLTTLKSKILGQPKNPAAGLDGSDNPVTGPGAPAARVQQDTKHFDNNMLAESKTDLQIEHLKFAPGWQPKVPMVASSRGRHFDNNMLANSKTDLKIEPLKFPAGWEPKVPMVAPSHKA